MVNLQQHADQAHPVLLHSPGPCCRPLAAVSHDPIRLMARYPLLFAHQSASGGSPCAHLASMHYSAPATCAIDRCLLSDPPARRIILPVIVLAVVFISSCTVSVLTALSTIAVSPSSLPSQPFPRPPTPSRATEFRSTIFCLTPQQREIAQRITSEVYKIRFARLKKTIVTKIVGPEPENGASAELRQRRCVC